MTIQTRAGSLKGTPIEDGNAASRSSGSIRTSVANSLADSIDRRRSLATTQFTDVTSSCTTNGGQMGSARPVALNRDSHSPSSRPDTIARARRAGLPCRTRTISISLWLRSPGRRPAWRRFGPDLVGTDRCGLILSESIRTDVGAREILRRDWAAGEAT